MPAAANSIKKGKASLPPPSGFLLTCDAPTKQFIKYLNDKKSLSDKFILEDLDSTHLLIQGRARREILKAVEDWMNENVWTNVERVGENLET